MIFNKLDATPYRYAYTFCSNEFKSILSGIVASYYEILKSECTLPNNENEICKHIFDNYFENDEFRKQYSIFDYKFDIEIRENLGRVDLRVLKKDPLLGAKAYYIFECKRIEAKNPDGISGLNAEYIKNGICRFVTEYYTTYFGENGMIGFVVEQVNIIDHVNSINMLLNKEFINDLNITVNANPVQNLQKNQIIENFEHLYSSRHKTLNEKEIVLHHLMLDFSSKIQ